MPSFISTSKNLTFLHVPKTAGVSVVHWLITAITQTGGTYRIVKENLGHPYMSTLETYNKSDNNFSVIRNPWDRMLSAYSYLTQIDATSNVNDLIKIYFDGEMPDTFDKFIQKIEEFNLKGTGKSRLESLNINWNFNTPCLDWADTKSKVTFLKYENLNEDFKNVMDIVGCDTALPHLNSSKHESYRDVYSVSSRNLVERWFAKDIEYGKYLF